MGDSSCLHLYRNDPHTSESNYNKLYVKMFVQMLRDTHTNSACLSVWVAAAAGRVCGHGLDVVLVLLIMTWGLQAEVVSMVRREHPYWDVWRLPGVVWCQHVWGRRTELVFIFWKKVSFLKRFHKTCKKYFNLCYPISFNLCCNKKKIRKTTDRFLWQIHATRKKTLCAVKA